MSEDKKTSFMQALDAWMDVNVIAPLIYSEDEEDVETTDEQIAQVKKAILTKVLDSYHNGRRAAGGAVRRELNQEAGASRPKAPAVAVTHR
jgi:hypothetical protein